MRFTLDVQISTFHLILSQVLSVEDSTLAVESLCSKIPSTRERHILYYPVSRMLTNFVEHASIAMCENAKLSFYSLNLCLDEKEYITAYLYCFNYSTSFSNDEFAPFQNSTKEARLLRNDTPSLKVRDHN